MRAIVGVCCVLVMVAYVEAESSEKFQKQIRALAESCKDVAKASDDDVETLVHLKDDFSNEGKCLAACVMERLELVVKGKFSDREKHLSTYKMLFAEEPKRLSKAEQVVDTCLKEAESKYAGQTCLMEHHAVICMLKITS